MKSWNDNNMLRESKEDAYFKYMQKAVDALDILLSKGLVEGEEKEKLENIAEELNYMGTYHGTPGYDF